MEIRTYLREKGYPKGWENVFRETRTDRKLSTRYLKDNEIDYCPSADLVFRIYYDLPPEKVQVVILGQDPYHDGKVDGYAFSVSEGKPMHSVKALITEANANSEVEDTIMPKTGDLSKWVQNGVFLLNACLTSKRGKAGHHMDNWLGMLEATIVCLTNLNKKIIWVFFGKEAQKYSSMVGEKGIKLSFPHPSPLNTYAGGFPGCKAFKIINDERVKQGKTPIPFHFTEED